MIRNDPQAERNIFERVRAALIMLCFGFGVLAYLIAIDRPEWFHIQPGTATAAAMARATDRQPESGKPARSPRDPA